MKEPSSYETGAPPKLPYPKSIVFIISNEFCERFSYYGMRTILVLYFRYVLLYSENTATQAFHIFAMACYFTPVLGAIIADSFLGKFWTILSISIVYAAGNIVLSFASINGTVFLTYLGLGFIALGTGGIKPCVSAFGGDQFAPEQKRELQRFFSLFYVSINAGSLLSTFITPILRQDVSCMGRPDCYPLAFGVPAILMVLAVIFFIVGKFITNYKMVPPQKDNIVVIVCKCVCHALTVKLFKKTPKKPHWLEYAEDRYDPKTINDVKALMSILFLYLPLPIFWALFDQQSSRWTLQAIRMNGQLGSFTIKPDQIQVINPLLVILMIPIFEYVIYPFLTKIKLFYRPLQRMTIGGLLAAAAFIICAFIQLKIEQEQPTALLSQHNHLAFVNGLKCNFTVESSFFNGSLAETETVTFLNVPRSEMNNFNANFKLESSQSGCPNGNYPVKANINATDGRGIVMLISNKILNNKQPDWVSFPNFMTKPEEGGAMLYTIFNIDNLGNQTFSVTEKSGALVKHEVNMEDKTVFGYLEKFEVEIKGKDIVMSVGDKSHTYNPDQGATYIQLITGDINDVQLQFKLTNIVEKNKMSVFIQLIQYLVITCAEIMFSVTGLEFSYSQAPKSMKSVLQACWLLTVAFGNLIVAIVADLKIFQEQSYEFFFFSGLMIIDIAIFAVMAYFYVPFKSTDNEESDVNENEKQMQLEPVKNKADWDE